MKNQIVIASGNKDKIRETQETLNRYEIIPVSEFRIDIDIEEDKDTFEENAIKKAETIAKLLNGQMCIADDSGIEIEYLNGFPGVHTKRWYKGTDRERNLEIINRLKEVPKSKRQVKFVTAIAISDGKHTNTAVTEIYGYVAENVKGNNGFGFDEIFELEDGRTLAEISEKEKNEVSARRKALELIKKNI